MNFIKCQDGFSEYRYYKPQQHFCEKIALKIDVCHDNDMMRFSFAICNEEDNFAKQTARELTDKRMNEGKYLVGRYDDQHSLKVNCFEIATVALERAKKGDMSDFAHSSDPYHLRRLTQKLIEAVDNVSLSLMVDDALNAVCEAQDEFDALAWYP